MPDKIVIGESSGKPVGFDLKLLIPTRLLIQANSGGGKSYLLRKLMEELYGKAQVIALDPEGEFSTLRERFGYVLVGEGGETPADTRSAEMLAERLLKLEASAICDLYESFRSHPMQRRQWVRLFLEALLNAPRSLWHPLIVIVDEAHKFCPQETPKAGSMTDREIINGCKDAMIALSTTGRKRGFCPVWATQRLAKVDKDASAEMFNRLVGMTIEDVDVDRAADLMSVSREDRHQFRASLRGLSPGQFYAFGRAISTERILIEVGKVVTTHPQSGVQRHTAMPPTPESIKKLLPQLSDLPKEAETRAKTEAELRAEVRGLKAQLTAMAKNKSVEVQTKTITVVDERAVVRAIKDRDREWHTALDTLRHNIGESVAELKIHLTAPSSTPGTIPSSVTGSQPFTPSPRPPQDPLPLHPQPPPHSNVAKLRAGAERMLSALCQWTSGGGGMTEGQMRSHAGMKKSGTFDTYMSDLRKGGYFERRNDGLLYATKAGFGYFGGNVPDAPSDTAGVLAVWEPKLRDGARRMLKVLISQGGGRIRREHLAEFAGLTKSGTFDTYISDLRTARLIKTGPGWVEADREVLFL